jgi:hypothetical protein
MEITTMTKTQAGPFKELAFYSEENWVFSGGGWLSKRAK